MDYFLADINNYRKILFIFANIYKRPSQSDSTASVSELK